MTTRRPSCLLVLVSAMTLWACGGDDLVLPQGAASAVQMVDGSQQVGVPGARLPDSLIVRLVDPSGAAVPNRTVLWVVKTGSGEINPTTGMTDAEGFASAEWTLGPEPGPNTVEAQVPSVGSVTFTAIATEDGGAGGGGTAPSPTRSSISVAPTTVPVGSGIATVTVTVLDDQGRPVPGATVTLEATGGGNTVTQPAGTTGADGIAIGTLGSSTPGAKVVSAAVNGSVALSQTVTITVSPAEAARIELIEGDGQSVPAGGQVPVQPAVRVVDAQGQPVEGVGVTFVVTGGGGGLTGADQTTNTDGIARVGGWTLGASPGTNTLEARSGSLQGSPIVFTAEGTGGTASVDRLVFQVEPPDVTEGQGFTVTVALVDANGTVVPLSGIFIYLGLFREGKDQPNNDALEGERFENTDNGVAVFDIYLSKKGRFQLRALTDDLPELGPHGPEPYLFSRVFEVH